MINRAGPTGTVISARDQTILEGLINDKLSRNDKYNTYQGLISGLVACQDAPILQPRTLFSCRTRRGYGRCCTDYWGFILFLITGCDLHQGSLYWVNCFCLERGGRWLVRWFKLTESHRKGLPNITIWTPNHKNKQFQQLPDQQNLPISSW